MTQDLTNKRVRCEVFSRVVGYLRPVSQWNEGKVCEKEIRKDYNKQLECCSN